MKLVESVKNNIRVMHLKVGQHIMHICIVCSIKLFLLLTALFLKCISLLGTLSAEAKGPTRTNFKEIKIFKYNDDLEQQGESH